MELQDLYADDLDRFLSAPATDRDLPEDQVASQEIMDLDNDLHDLARFEGEGGSWNV